MSQSSREREIFEACLDLDAKARREYLETMCAGSPGLKERMVRLLQAHDSSVEGVPEVNTTSLPLVSELTSFADYDDLQKLGEGGMGVVYRARDVRLERHVALKVLRPEIARDVETMARFRREARVLALLSHPNISVIYGLEEESGLTAIVLELVEGPTLEDRIAEGPIPLEETLAILHKIAEALEAAHDKGITHRDLKPANIKLTTEGGVKVLDFGLAKTPEESVDGRSGSVTRNLTSPGLILGTPAYMSPEQAQGKTVDRRSDIWALGCVFYEMLTGRPAFDGQSVAELIAGIVKGEPDWGRLPGLLPGVFRELLRRCLEKDPRQRLQAVGEIRILVSKYLANPAAFRGSGFAKPEGARRGIRLAAPLLLVVLAAVVVWLFKPSPDAIDRGPVHLEIAVQEAAPLFTSQASAAVISPDGRRVAYVTGSAGEGGGRLLHLRSMDQAGTRTLEGTEGAYNPFFSPDGLWVGFVTSREVLKVSVSGGEPLTLGSVNRSRGSSWGPGGKIVVAPERVSGLFLIPENGGEPEPLTQLEQAEWSHRWPQFLPDGRNVLFTVRTSPGAENSRIEVVNVDTGVRKLLYQGGSYGRYAASGHLLFWREGSVFGAPFDVQTLELTAAPRPALHRVPGNLEGAAHFDVSDTGTLLHLEGTTLAEKQQRMVWVDRNNSMTPASTLEGIFSFGMKLSPDEQKVAIGLNTGGNVDIWVTDLSRNVPNRVTFEEAADGNPIWSPDGDSLFFSSNRSGSAQLYRVRVGGGDEPQLLPVDGDYNRFPNSVSPNGRYLVYHEDHPNTDSDLWVYPLEEGGRPAPYLVTRHRELGARFSPDGRWLAFVSHESGNGEVYVRPFPAREVKWRVSSNGGSNPRWSQDGRWVYFRQDRQVFGASISASSGGPNIGKPELLFDIPVSFSGSLFDMSADGQRVLIVQSVPDDLQPASSGPGPILVTLRWFDELERIFQPVR